MKNIFLIPTENPSRLYKGDNGLLAFGLMQTSTQSRNDYFTNQNIYITSDEEIKDGDWFLTDDKRVEKCAPDWRAREWHKKIIITTDQDLIKDGVQPIDDEFLEFIVKNTSCESVKVDKNWNYPLDKRWEYKIIIPKEEPKKVLTEEDIFNQKDIDAVTDYINKKQQKQHLIDMMKGDEELGLYDKSREIKFEDVFNDEKRKKVKRVIRQHKVLQGLSLVNPAHLEMTSNGHGEFPDGYKLTEKGIQYIIEQLNKE